MPSLFELARQSSHLTPLMRQYMQYKQQYPEALVLFQVGDFYELFFEDAQQAAAFLGIVLTKRGVVQTTQGLIPIPLCGVPKHTADHYIVKLIKGGFTVVVCDQIEIAQPGKLVDRAVTQIFTPGLILDDALLQEGRAHYVGSWFRDDTHDALCWYDPLAGVMSITHFVHDTGLCESELIGYKPEELIIDSTHEGVRAAHATWARSRGYRVIDAVTGQQETDVSAWLADMTRLGSSERVAQVLAVPAVHEAVRRMVNYLMRYLPLARQSARSLLTYHPDDYVLIDAASLRNLEIFENSHDGTTEHTFFASINRTITGMGARRLTAWIAQPLRNATAIRQRQDRIHILMHDSSAREQVRQGLKRIGDLERIVGRITLGRAQIHDIKKLCEGLAALPELGVWCPGDVREISSLYMRLRAAIHGDDTSTWRIAPGYHAELDRLRQLADRSTQAIAELEAREQSRTGISTLKIRYIQHQGYAVEVTKQHTHQVPPDYRHIQSLTNRDRFIYQELLDQAYEVTRAQAQVTELEQQLYDELMQSILVQVPLLKQIATALSELDALLSLAHVALEFQYVRPHIAPGNTFEIIQGRHPVVEQQMVKETPPARFIPNDYQATARAWVITGPNMGGKSTFLRQNALIALLAHMGSFVPAQFASLPILDRIYTRLGSGDRLALGKSTFYVEMEETARICRQATPASLVILDEVGRGTSTHDGLAIAQAVLEYLCQAGPWCLFATHYHELAHMSQIQYSDSIALYHAASIKDESTGQILLLHKIVPGIAQGSFGLQVARAAQLPEEIIARAEQILSGSHTFRGGHAQQLESNLEGSNQLLREHETRA